MITIAIPLTQGKVALIDEGDAPLVLPYRWHRRYSPREHTDYAGRSILLPNGKPHLVFMHSVILLPIPGLVVDHRNGDGLDNRRENLRYATTSQNGGNRRIGANNTSGYRGVDYRKRRLRWRARIAFEGERIELGHFGSPEEAARAYDLAARRLFGEFARLNMPD